MHDLLRRELRCAARLFEEVTAPEQVVVIPQSAGAGLDVRLLQKDGRPVLEVPHVLVVLPPGEKVTLVPAQTGLLEPPLELGEKRLPTRQETRLK